MFMRGRFKQAGNRADPPLWVSLRNHIYTYSTLTKSSPRIFCSLAASISIASPTHCTKYITHHGYVHEATEGARGGRRYRRRRYVPPPVRSTIGTSRLTRDLQVVSPAAWLLADWQKPIRVFPSWSSNKARTTTKSIKWSTRHCTRGTSFPTRSTLSSGRAIIHHSWRIGGRSCLRGGRLVAGMNILTQQMMA